MVKKKLLKQLQNQYSYVRVLDFEARSHGLHIDGLQAVNGMSRSSLEHHASCVVARGKKNHVL